ncbi:M4 family metallopeptidase, partial [Nocardioides sp.]|uniref:M4 family metallopeptidase n=1 Tax=Nocardioides sp. TaxID=35761 RepID=UPI002EDB54C2
MTCRFVPPYLLRRVAPDSLVVDERLRAGRTVPVAERTLLAGGPPWTVHTADNRTTLPGRVVRTAAQPESGDAAVDEAATGITGALALFAEVYGRSSYDGDGAPVSLTVHYGRDYDNAFWDGRQLVFGDGDGRVFDRFTKPVDVLGHELTHAVTEHTAGLRYQGQSGALNESVSDVFAACLKQRLLGQTAADADWLIGAGIFLPGVQARALRDMAAPGTAYDDPQLGRDPQVGHLRDYVDTADDNGGVHLNSGIPNRAFQLAATAIGGSTWEGAGRIWYAALTSGIGPDTDFAGFAAATVAAAGGRAEAVRAAWAEVGVTVDVADPAGGAAGAPARGP